MSGNGPHPNGDEFLASDYLRGREISLSPSHSSQLIHTHSLLPHSRQTHPILSCTHLSFRTMSVPLNASSRVGTHADLIHVVSSHLRPSSLHTNLTTSTVFHAAAIPLLYNTVHIRRDSRIPVGASATPFDESVDAPWSKNAALRHIKVCWLYEHEHDSCPGQNISELETLQVLHLAGGGRPKGIGSELCQSNDCAFVAACSRANKVIMRSLHNNSQGYLPPMPNLRTIVLKLRPCQFTLGGYRRDRSDPPTNRAVTQRFEAFSNAELHLVFWDTYHVHRVDLMHPLAGYTRSSTFQGRGGRFPDHPDRDCMYCNQRSCVHKSVDGFDSLSGLLWQIGRGSDVPQVIIYNAEDLLRFDSPARREQLPMHPAEMKKTIVESFQEGRQRREAKKKAKERSVDGEVKAGTEKKVDDQAALPDPVVFQTAAEYLARATPDEIDEEEQPYWDLLVNPSDEIVRLRNEVLETFPGHTMPPIGLLPKESLEKMLEWAR